VNVTDIPSPPQQSARIALVARRSARVLQVLAAVIALATVIANWILVTTDTNQFFGGSGSSPGLPGKYKVAQFLQQTVSPLGWAGLVLAAGFVLEITALRAERGSPQSHDPFAPDRAVQADDTSPVIQRAGGAAVPTIVPRREAPITVDTVDDTVWRR
jgi:hypothetical protein